MFTACIALATLGFIFVCTLGNGPGNPFTIFFAMWSLVTWGIWLSQDSFLMPSDEVWWMLLAVMALYLLASFGTLSRRKTAAAVASWEIHYRERCLDMAQWACVAVVPMLFWVARDLAGGEIFSSEGYMALRTAMTEYGEGFGVWSYFVTLSFAVAAVRVMQYAWSAGSIWNMVIAVMTASSMAFLSTGRTFFLMLFCFLVFPLVVTGKVKLRGIALAGAALAGAFMIVALMTKKGVSTDATLTDNLEGIVTIFRGYVLSPTLAMGNLADGGDAASAGGSYSMRFFQVLLERTLGMEFDVVPLIRDYVNVPNPVNVFTVMDPYFRDFGVTGVVVFAFVSAFAHLWLYRKMRAERGPWIFIYSATLFALVMQFFQDMYMTLFSTWIQTFFWYMVLVQKRRFAEKTKSHALVMMRKE